MLKKIILFFVMFHIPSVVLAENYKDRIIAVVNDKVILQSEIKEEIDSLSKEEIINYSTLNEEAIIKKIIEKLIDENLLIQAAERFGIAISDIALEKNILELALRKT